MRLAAKIIPLIVISTLSVAAAERPGTASIDLSLTAAGHLVSQCQSEAGLPVSGATVELRRNQQLVTKTLSRSDGWFRLENLTPGTYELSAHGWRHAVRIWSADAAPPAAADPIVVILTEAAATHVDAANDASSPALMQGSSDSTPPGEREPVKDLSFDEGAARSDHRPQVEIAETSIDASHLDEGMAHALHTVGSLQEDVPFDPFGGAGDDIESPLAAADDHETVETSEPPQFPVAEPLATKNVVNSAPAAGPPLNSPPPTAQTIPRRVGPTVGDVVITSVGIAGITMGVIAIHKYDNRRIRRIVSP